MDREQIDKVKEFVSSHLRSEFSLAELASHAGYSAYHFAREFKDATGKSAMEYVRERRIFAAVKDIEGGKSICTVAQDYCFDTHAGFTKAFTGIIGCSPKELYEHAGKMVNKEKDLMEGKTILIRQICADDVNDLWENVYSAMTPRQIREEVIEPAILAYKEGRGIHLVACADGKVVMSLPMQKPFWLPVGYLFDNCFVLTGGIEDEIMKKLLEEMKRLAKREQNITTLVSPQSENSKSAQAFEALGFKKAFSSGGWDYLMMSL